MMNKKTIILLFFLIQIIQSYKIKFESSGDETYVWKEVFNQFPSSTGNTYGRGKAINQDMAAVGDDYKVIVYIFKYDGTNWQYIQNITGEADSRFGLNVDFSADSSLLAISAHSNSKFFIYSWTGSEYVQRDVITGDYGSYLGLSLSLTGDGNRIAVGTMFYGVGIFEYASGNWTSTKVLTETGSSSYGYVVAISKNGEILLVGDQSENTTYVYSYDSGQWNNIQNLTRENKFGYSLSICDDGSVFVVGTYYSNAAFIYRKNGATYDLDKSLSGTISTSFGMVIAINEDGNEVLVGNSDTSSVYVYIYQSGDWVEQPVMKPSSYSYSFGSTVEISGNWSIVTKSNSPRGVYILEQSILTGPGIELVNCTSLYSKFKCYWTQPENDVSLQFQIDYGYDWTTIQNPSFDSSVNVFYEEFTSQNYSEIYGNEEYSIQIKACNLTTSECGNPTTPTTLTTMIDAVEDFELTALVDTINVSWTPPDVRIIGGVPHLYQYLILVDGPDFHVYTPSNDSTFYEATGLTCGEIYTVYMIPCRTFICGVGDAGEMVYDEIQVGFGPVFDLKCSVSDILDVHCSWLPPNSSVAPSYYNLTSQSGSLLDFQSFNVSDLSFNFSVNLPNQYYQINVSACASNGGCGVISSFQIRIADIPHPNIISSYSGIELIQITFSQVSQAKAYLVTIDDHLSWINFSSLIPNGNEMIGTINQLDGNVEYGVAVRGCTDSSCQPQYLGDSSATISIKAQLGNITGLTCSSSICGFDCEWDSLELSEGLQAISFWFNQNLTCLNKSSTTLSLTGLLGGANYDIYVSASADPDCESSNYSGLNASTSITTQKIPSPSIIQSNSKPDEIELIFTNLIQAKSYLVSIDNQQTWISFSSLIPNGEAIIGLIDNISGNVEYEVAVRGCSDSSCTFEYLGDPSESIPVKAQLSNITGLNCSATSCGFECTWDSIDSSGIEAFAIIINLLLTNQQLKSIDQTQSICLDKSSTNFSISNLTGGAKYEITIFASADPDCKPNDYSGLNFTFEITTDKLPAPSIIQSNSKVEEIELIFSKLSAAKSYLVSIDNKQTWISFSSLISNGTEMIGTINQLDGNVEYEVAVRGCSDLICQTQNLGDSSTTISIKPKLGNITGFNCNPIICGFECEWNPLELSTGLNGYSLSYGSKSICLDKSSTNFSISNLIGGAKYEITIFASADPNCKPNDYSGLNFTFEITTDKLPAPSIIQSNSKVEEIELIFSKLSAAKSYLVSIDNKQTWITFSSLISNGNKMTGTINQLDGNVEYEVAVRGCSDSICTFEYLGYSSATISIKPKLGNITGFNCNPIICGFECEWNPLELSTGLNGYSLSYGSKSICLDKSSTNFSISNLTGGAKYEITIFASADPNCKPNDYSGLSSIIKIETNKLPAPSIIQSNSKVEEIELIFTKLSEAKSYLVSIDGRMTWINFTTLISNGNEMIGTINQLDGNFEYQVSVVGCIDLICQTQNLGYPSTTISIKPKLGNITGFNCNPIICGFECEWNPLELSTGLSGYSLSYGSGSICVSKLMNQISIFNLIGGENYEITIFASGDWKCESSEYSGANTTTSITTIAAPTQEATESSSNTKVIIPAVIVPIVVVAIIIIIIMWIKSKSKKRKNQNQQNQNKEMELSDDI
ncbi:fasciclin-2-like protein [Anaeramoeba ignava]|uniref:Fasciclin-2-like protein n=1 Tax=Anaeramoeba ignava TaxID=1746090 RepID=A0A9Q0RA18_ANAIG|nr:fasciclin-2-like protein [Anaeramoeba ignava]